MKVKLSTDNVLQIFFCYPFLNNRENNKEKQLKETIIIQQYTQLIIITRVWCGTVGAVGAVGFLSISIAQQVVT